VGLLCLVAGVAIGCSTASAQEAIPVSRVKTDNSLRIGLNRHMFRDLPSGMVNSLAKPFQKLLESQTSLTGEVAVCSDAQVLAQQLYDGNVEIGVFHGFEYAWLKGKYPELEALLVAVPAQKKLQAFLVVRKDSTVTDWPNLSGCKVALPFGTREHSRLFLDRGCRRNERVVQVPEIVAPDSVEDSLHEVVDGNVAATIVDGGGMTSFSIRFPGRFNKLKIVMQSDVFPLNVVVYRKSSLDANTINRVRQGLTTAHTTPQGKTMMTMWKLSGFENIPANYEEQLAAIVKAYPPPPEMMPIK